MIKDTKTTHKNPPVPISRKSIPKNLNCPEFDKTWYTYQINHAEKDNDNDYT